MNITCFGDDGINESGWGLVQSSSHKSNLKKENLNYSDPHEPLEESSIETLHCDASHLTT